MPAMSMQSAQDNEPPRRVGGGSGCRGEIPAFSNRPPPGRCRQRDDSVRGQTRQKRRETVFARLTRAKIGPGQVPPTLLTPPGDSPAPVRLCAAKRTTSKVVQRPTQRSTLDRGPDRNRPEQGD